MRLLWWPVAQKHSMISGRQVVGLLMITYSLRIFNLNTEEQIFEYELNGIIVSAVQLTAQLLLIATSLYTILMFDIATRRIVRAFVGHTDDIRFVFQLLEI
jgi:hypothetical protein